LRRRGSVVLPDRSRRFLAAVGGNAGRFRSIARRQGRPRARALATGWFELAAAERWRLSGELVGKRHRRIGVASDGRVAGRLQR
nr:hypothetical protein [Tanacetum cinerariifolium]